jgi:hypothetical protein
MWAWNPSWTWNIHLDQAWITNDLNEREKQFRNMMNKNFSIKTNTTIKSTKKKVDDINN